MLDACGVAALHAGKEGRMSELWEPRTEGKPEARKGVFKFGLAAFGCVYF
jgi:hypothetical protein